MTVLMRDAHHLDTGSVPVGWEGQKHRTLGVLLEGISEDHPTQRDGAGSEGEAAEVWDVGLTCHCCQARADGGRGAGHAAGMGAAIEQLKVFQRIRKAPSGRRDMSGAGPTASRGKGHPMVSIPHSPLSLGSRTARFGHGHAVQRLLQEVLTEELGHLR